jgi:hypothetical protein
MVIDHYPGCSEAMQLRRKLVSRNKCFEDFLFTMRNSTIVSSCPLACDAVKLGRLILDVKSPEQGFFDSGLQGDSIIKPTDMLAKKQYNFKDLLHRISRSKFNSTLTKYLTATHDRREDKLTYVQSIQNTRFQLLNSTEVFERICKSDQARRWLETAIAFTDAGIGRCSWLLVWRPCLMLP